MKIIIITSCMMKPLPLVKMEIMITGKRIIIPLASNPAAKTLMPNLSAKKIGICVNSMSVCPAKLRKKRKRGIIEDSSFP
jgi:hypothetical protein